jgi:hypothetical protein
MMMLISFLALLGNAACLYLLQKSKSKEAHIQASVIFTNNDVMNQSRSDNCWGFSLFYIANARFSHWNSYFYLGDERRFFDFKTIKIINELKN